MVGSATEHSKPCNKQVTKNVCQTQPFLKKKRNSSNVYKFFFVFFLLESAEPSRWPSINPLLKNKVHISATRSKLVNKVKWMHATLPESCMRFQASQELPLKQKRLQGQWPIFLNFYTNKWTMLTFRTTPKSATRSCTTHYETLYFFQQKLNVQSTIQKQQPMQPHYCKNRICKGLKNFNSKSK